MKSISFACNSQSALSSSDESRDMAYIFTEDIKTDTIVTFLYRLANKTSSNVPHKCEKNLPHFTTKQVYETYVAEIESVYPSDICYSLPYCCSCWQKEWSFINVRKVSLFSKCGECERLSAYPLVLDAWQACANTVCVCQPLVHSNNCNTWIPYKLNHSHIEA